MELNISIPLDEEGFIELECDYCKNRFMIHNTVYKDDANLHFFCPICGLPNDVSSFFCPEVLEAAQRKAINYALDEIQKALGPTIKKFNKNGLVKMSIQKPKKEPEKELYSPLNQYVVSHQSCCNVDVKVSEIDKQIGVYCPICGGSNL